nr:ATPase, F1/V1/A1 complex, alpha/beta subunit, zinc knuckle CX2CX4HX4C [Tanacetum cinerariifolium]
MWGKFGIKNVIPNGNGVFLFKFKNIEGIQYVIEIGAWMVNGKPTPGFARVLVDVEAGKEQENAEFVRVQYRKRGVKKVNVSDGNKKEIEGNQSKNVMYKPVGKGDSKEREKTRHGNEEVQMNEKVSQNEARNKNKFDVLREYDGNEMPKIEEIEEDDVFECSGMASSMKVNEVIGLDSNVLQECC